MSGPGGILALYLGLRTGWAYGDLRGDSQPDHGTWRLSQSDTDHGEIGAAFLDVLSDTVKIHRPILLVINSRMDEVEAANTPDAASTAVLCIGLAFSAKVYAWRRDLRLIIPEAPEIRKAVLTSTHKGDDAAMYWCRSMKWEPKLAPAAHALVTWHYARTEGQKAAA